MLCYKNWVFQNILLLFGRRYSLRCSHKVTESCAGLVKAHIRATHFFFMINLHIILTSLIAKSSKCCPSWFYGQHFVHSMNLPPHPPLFDQNQEVLEEFMKSFEVPNATVTIDQCARQPPPTTQESGHLWFCLKIILSNKNCHYALLCPTIPFKILCTSSLITDLNSVCSALVELLLRNNTACSSETVVK